MLAIAPSTPVSSALSHLNGIDGCQLLAVSPGKSGQVFDPNTVGKIKELKKAIPQLIIEVDGGINLDTAAQCRDAGADQLAVGSFIFNSSNPAAQYKKLVDIS